MKFLWVLCGFLGVLGFNMHALAANEVAPRRFELGAHAGYAITEQVLEVTRAIPLGLDFGYRLTRRWVLGASVEYGVVHETTQAEDADASLSGRHVRATASVRYHFDPERLVDPWLGLGVGYDWVSYDGRGTAYGYAFGQYRAYHASARGPELLDAQLGVDFNVLPAFAVGPVFGASIVDYTAGAYDEALAERHEVKTWWTVGAKCTLRF